MVRSRPHEPIWPVALQSYPIELAASLLALPSTANRYMFLNVVVNGTSAFTAKIDDIRSSHHKIIRRRTSRFANTELSIVDTLYT